MILNCARIQLINKEIESISNFNFYVLCQNSSRCCSRVSSGAVVGLDIFSTKLVDKTQKYRTNTRGPHPQEAHEHDHHPARSLFNTSLFLLIDKSACHYMQSN